MIEDYQTTSHTPEALYRLTETSLALGVPEEAQSYSAVLGANYPGNEWYEKAFDLMQRTRTGSPRRLIRSRVRCRSASPRRIVRAG